MAIPEMKVIILLNLSWTIISSKTDLVLSELVSSLVSMTMLTFLQRET